MSNVISKLVLVLVISLVSYTCIKYIKFRNYLKLVNNIDLHQLSKSYTSYYYLKNAEAFNIDDFLLFLKKSNTVLYSQIKDLNLNYGEKEGVFKGFYLFGFDDEDNLLKHKLFSKPKGLNFLEFLNSKGDLILEIDPVYNFEFNALYEVKKDTIIKIHNLKWRDAFIPTIGCNEFTLKKGGSTDFIDRSEGIFIVNEKTVNTNYSSYNKRTHDIYVKYLEENYRIIDKRESVYLAFFKSWNIDNFECYTTE